MKTRTLPQRLLIRGIWILLLAVPLALMGGQMLQMRHDHDLIMAIRRKDTTSALSALQQGADSDARAPLQPDESLLAMLKRLWQRYRSPHTMQSQYGASALQLAVEQDLPPVIKALLQHHAHDINARAKVTDGGRYTDEGPLVVMVMGDRHPDLALMFLQCGVALSKDDRKALLCAAASRKSIEVVRYLLDQGTDANAFDSWNAPDKTPPLLSAVENDDIAMTRLLLEHGARLNVGYIVSDAMSTAANNGNDAIIRLLLAHGAQADRPMRMGTPLCFAAENGHLAAVKTLIAAGARADYIGYGGDVLGHAMNNKVPERIQADIVALLLLHGADPNVGYKGYFNMTGPAGSGRTSIVELLLKYGEDVNVVDRDCETPLSCAVAGNHVETTRLLLRHGARQIFIGEKHIWKGDEVIFKRSVVDVKNLAKTTALRHLLQTYR